MITSNELINAISVSWEVACEIDTPHAWDNVRYMIDGMKSLTIYAGLDENIEARNTAGFLWSIALKRSMLT